MIDLDYLESCISPNDELVKMFRDNIDISPFLKVHKIYPFTSYITHSLVSDPNIVKLAKKYIVELLRNKSKYGFLYHLNGQKLIIPLHFQFNGELIIDPQNYFAIVNIIQDIARDFSCPDNLVYEITKIELLYFFTLFVNIHLNWITIDHFLKCIKTHGYLIGSRI